MTQRDPEEERKKEMLWERHLEKEERKWAEIAKEREAYDKLSGTIAGGGLVLSMSFIQNVTPLDQALAKPLLFFSWILLTSSLMFTLISLLISIEFNTHIFISMVRNKHNHQIDKRYRLIRHFFRYGSGVLLMAGIITMLTYVIINVK